MELVVNNKYRLKQDVNSKFMKNHLYGKENATVKLISIATPAAIVEGLNGKRFSVLINQLK